MINKEKKLGFTLVELVISMAVIGIILSVVVISLNKVRGTKELERGQAEFATQLKLTQNMAFTYQIYSQINQAPELGYGIHYDYPAGTGYFLFANLADQPGIYGWDEGSDLLIEEFNLPKGIEFSGCQYHNSPASGACDIIFELGKDIAGVRTDSGEETDPEELTFTLKEAKSDKTKNVIIKRWTGLIYED